MSTTRQESDGFDANARELHRVAVDHVSASTLSRLRASRDGPPRNVPGAGGWRWGAAALASTVLAVVVGTQLLPFPFCTFRRTARKQAYFEVVPDYPAGLAALDEDPDLFVWLAAQAEPLPLEQL